MMEVVEGMMEVEVVEVVQVAGHSPIISRFESLNAQSSRTMKGCL